LVVQQREVGGPQHRQQRLHAVHRDALGELGQHVGDGAADPVLHGRHLGRQRGRPLPHLIGEQQLPARHRDERLDVDLGDGALVGDGEHPHLGHLVAPELDAHRVLGGGREHVEDAAAHRELSPLADHVDPGVGQGDQAFDDLVEGALGAEGQRHRLDLGQLRRHRLQQRARRGDHDPKRRAQPGVVGMG
jgi:hypothetical protein